MSSRGAQLFALQYVFLSVFIPLNLVGAGYVLEAGALIYVILGAIPMILVVAILMVISSRLISTSRLSRWQYAGLGAASGAVCASLSGIVPLQFGDPHWPPEFVARLFWWMAVVPGAIAGAIAHAIAYVRQKPQGN